MADKNFFSSDWHLSHDKIIELGGRPFKDVKTMDEVIIDNMLTKIPKGGSLYFLGDLTFDKGKAKETLETFQKYGIKFYWIIGNHDMKLKPRNFADKCELVDYSYIFNKGKTTIHLHHFPLRIWQRSYTNSFHLYGHIHKFSIEKVYTQHIPYGKSLNVNVEFNAFMPYSLKDIIDIMENMPNNIDYEMKIRREEVNRLWK